MAMKAHPIMKTVCTCTYACGSICALIVCTHPAVRFKSVFLIFSFFLHLCVATWTCAKAEDAGAVQDYETPDCELKRRERVQRYAELEQFGAWYTTDETDYYAGHKHSPPRVLNGAARPNRAARMAPDSLLADRNLAAFYGINKHVVDKEKEDVFCIATTRKRKQRAPKVRDGKSLSKDETQQVKYLQTFIDYMNEEELKKNIRKNQVLRDEFEKKKWEWGRGWLYQAAKARLKSARARLTASPKVSLH
jgi:hypothetical protein